MNLEEFLKKYNCAMNLKEIDEIEDKNILEIKRKYWELKHNAFLDEHNISDIDLENVYDSLTQKEEQELKEYYKFMQK